MKTKLTKTLAVLFFFSALVLNAQAQNKPEFYLSGLQYMLRKGNSTNEQRIAILKKMIPADIKDQTIYSLSALTTWYYTKVPGKLDEFTDDNYFDLCQRMDSTGYKFAVSTGNIAGYPAFPEPPQKFTVDQGGYYITTRQIDSIFKYTKNCTGVMAGENLWTYNAQNTNEIIAILRVCKKYNKKYILAEGGWGYNTFLRFFNDFYTELHDEGLGAYLQPTFKTTKPYGALATQGALLGSWVTNVVGDYGSYNDSFVWSYGSFGHANQFPAYAKSDHNELLYPYTHFLKTWLSTIAMGGKINYSEQSSFLGDGRPDPNFVPYLYPFIKGLTQHDMLPGKAAVLAKTKAIANPYGGTYTLSDGTAAAYSSTNLLSYNYNKVNYKPAGGTNAEPFARLYKMTSGIWADTTYTNSGSATDKLYDAAYRATGQKQLLNALVREMIPNNPRYAIIPVLPHPDAVVPSGIEKVALSSYQTDAGLKTKFESLYPPVADGNEAWAVEVDNRFFVINSHENADIDQNFVFNLGTSGIKSLSGTMPLQNILFGKREIEGNYWFQSNGYGVSDGKFVGQRYKCVVKTSTLKFNCDERPEVIIEDGKTGSVEQTWDPVTNTLTLIINHSAGAVNFNVVSNTSVRSAQTITFDSLPSDKIPGEDFSPGATSTSELPVSYSSSNPAVAIIVDNQIRVTGVGTVQITASQPGSTLYTAAPEVVQTLTVLSTPLSKPYGANVIPGIIEAENYDIGIEGRAYHDTSPGNNGDLSLRPVGDVDLNICNDTDGGYKIESIVGGEWLDYTVQVASTKTYPVEVRCASTSSGGQFRIEIDGVDISGIMNVPNTWGFTNWASVTKEIPLTAGMHKMRLYFINGDYQINKLIFGGAPRVDQTITFSGLPVDKIPGDTDFSPGATSTSGLPATYTSSNPAVATIINNKIHILTAGTTQITAGQPGSAVYFEAPELVQTLTVLASPVSKPYAANLIPGIIEAENYDIGTEGNTYHDSSAGNSGDQIFRAGGDVDLNTCDDTGGGYKVQSIAAGEWLDYTVQVAESKIYLVDLRCASSSEGGQLRIEIDGVDVSGIINVPNTSGFSKWVSVTKNIQLTSGIHKMRVHFINGGYHFNRLTFTGAQTITFNSLPADKIPGDADFSPAATSSSGLAVTYTSSSPAVATIVNNQIHIVSNGTTQITAQQTGDSAYSPAPNVVQTLTVLPSRPFAANVIPGIIEVENYDIGIKGKAYHDTSVGNTGDQSFRPGGDVDVNICNDTGGGYKTQSTAGGEWLVYTVQVAENGNYLVELRCANSASGGQLRIEMDGVDVSGIINVPNTSSFGTWASVTKNIQLTAGTHRMRLFLINGGYHINKLIFSEVTGSQARMSAKQELSFHPTDDDSDTATIVYPNPFSGNEFNLKVSNKIATDVEVEIYSTIGVRVLNKKYTDVKQGESILNINLPAISTGVYLVKVKSMEGIKTFKVIKK
ncbi:carbohydrate-binding protein [Flavobacterium sp. FlaQc-48]|uniref:carbohydrate-binding protein n=1 Tax=Flavobacterium sp. FlaQc-48 TaxID=3374181 RepID=UPI00375825C0